jgi:hypothetical protein
VSTESKANALKRGRINRTPQGSPSAAPLPPPPQPLPPTTTPTGRATAGRGRRGHLRKLSLELKPDEHDRLKMWLLTAFGGDAKATPVLRALLSEAYTDPALTERVRRHLTQSHD